MSWGYFADVRLSLPTAAWNALQAKKPADVVLAKGWSGLEDADLETSFGRPITRDETFADVLAWDCYESPESIKRVDTDGDTTSVRVCLLLDKSLLDLAYPLATLIHAARGDGAAGALRLVNDGTYAGEDGVELTLADGTITAQKLTNGWAISEALGDELYDTNAILATLGFEPASVAGVAASGGEKGAINPFMASPIEPATSGAGVPLPRPPARKPRAKKSVAKKTAAKKAGTKRAAAKKAAPKKASTKKPVAKKAVAKRPVAKKAPAKKKAAARKAPTKKAAKKRG